MPNSIFILYRHPKQTQYIPCGTALHLCSMSIVISTTNQFLTEDHTPRKRNSRNYFSNFVSPNIQHIYFVHIFDYHIPNMTPSSENHQRILNCNTMEKECFQAYGIYVPCGRRILVTVTYKPFVNPFCGTTSVEETGRELDKGKGGLSGIEVHFIRFSS